MVKNIYDFYGHCLHYVAHTAITKKLEGNIIELGAGWNSLCMGSILKFHGRHKKVFACDCFEGLPYTDEIDGVVKSDLTKGLCFQGDVEHFTTEIKNMGLENHVILIPGLIEDTLEAVLGSEIFCFAWCDVDLHKPTLVGYKFLEDRIVKGGILGFHDYEFVRCPGIKKVVDETLDRDKYKKIYRSGSSIFFQRQ